MNPDSARLEEAAEWLHVAGQDLRLAQLALSGAQTVDSQRCTAILVSLKSRPWRKRNNGFAIASKLFNNIKGRVTARFDSAQESD